MFDFKKYIAKCLRGIADKIDAGTSEITEQEAMDILKVVAHESMSKEQACNYLNMSRSRFDTLIREKKIPKGKKISGYKELRWYRDELDACKKK